MYPHGARPTLTPSLSRPRVLAIPASLPVPLHVTSSRKVHLSADGIINIIQEISFYAEGYVKSLAGKQLKEVHSQPTHQERGRFSAETSARVFVGERLIRMHIQTAIRPNTSDSLEIDEVFHFAENQEALVVPIAFEATLERDEGENPAVEFDLSSPIVVTLKQRILKDAGEQYKVLQAIEMRANETDARPTQELARKTTITQPTNETAKFRERIFAGTDVLRVDRDVIFVVDRPVLALSERREYMPSKPLAPRRRSASLTQRTPRVSYTPEKPRSRSASWSEDSENDYPTAREDLPTATSPYSLIQTESDMRIPPCNGLRTARDVSPASSTCDRSSRSQRKKWTVNSVVAKPGAATPERYDRARVMRSLSTARNLSLSPMVARGSEHRLKPAASPHNGEIQAVKSVPMQPEDPLGPNGESLKPAVKQRKLSTARNRSMSPAVSNRGSEHRLKTARSRSPNGEIHAIKTIPIAPAPELGPHGECVLVEGMEVLKCAAPVDSLIRTCAEGNSPRDRSSSDCSTAGEIRSCYSVLDKACASAPLSSPRPMPRTMSNHSTPVRTARHISPMQQQLQDPSSAAGLNKRRGLFGYGTRPTTPSRSARSPALKTAVGGLTPSPMRTAQKVVLSPMHTAVSEKSLKSQKSHKSQKRSHKESKRSGAKDRSEKRRTSTARLVPIVPPSAYRTPSSTTVGTGPTRNLFGTVPSNDCSLASMITARTPTSRTARATRSPAAATLATARSRSRDDVGEKCVPHADGKLSPPRVAVPYTPLKLENWADYDGSGCKFGKHDTPSVKTARSTASSVATGVSQSPARVYQPRRLLFGDVLTSPNTSLLNTARSRGTTSPYRPAQEGLSEDAPKTARAHTTARDGTMTARSPAQSLKTARHSPYDKNLVTGREMRTPDKSLKTARNSPYDKTARERSAASPARGLPTARGNTERSPALMTARQSPYDKSARSPAALRTAVPSPYDQNVVTGRELRTPDKSLKTARNSPYDKSARSPALITALLSPYEQKVLTARAARSPAHSTKTARASPYDKTARGHDRGRSPVATADPPSPRTARSPYERTARSPADGIRTAAEAGKSPAAPRTARALSPPGGPRSVYLAPQMAPLNRQQQEEYTQVVTARAVSPFKRADTTTSPLRPSMTARDATSAPRSTMTARDALNSTVSCISGGRDSDARFTARSPAPPSRSPISLSRTQSPMTRSTASNLATARSPRSPHVDTGSPSNLYTAREMKTPMRTGIRGGVSPASLRTAREPRSQLRTAATRTPEHNTMPDAQARQEDSYSEQCQLTFQKTPSGYTQKPTHAEQQLATGQQRTPTKTTTDSIYYSARATTPSRTLRADDVNNNNDVTATRRTPKRDYSQTAVLHSSPHVRTAVNRTPVKQAPAADEVPKCSLKTGCQAVHVPRNMISGPDSDKDEPHTARVAMTPERAALLSARDVGAPRTPSAPIHDMRTPRTARRTNPASPASSMLRSPSVTASSRMRTAVSPDAQSNSNYSNEDVVTARRGGAPGGVGVVSSSRSPRTATARGWAAAPRGPTPAVPAAGAVDASSKPRVIVRANQADGKIHVEVCLSFKLNTTGTIRVRGEVASALHPRTVSVNGQQIWSDSTRH